MARRRALARLAGSQRGFFTSADAAGCGYDRSAASKHRQAGNWLATAAPGVWRLAEWCSDGSTRVAQTASNPDAAHAWALWSGPRFQATSWTALELLGLVEPGCRAVHLIPTPTGPDFLRSRARRRRFSEARNAGELVLHSAQLGWLAPVMVDGVAVRPVAEALCVAVAYADTGSSLPIEQAAALVSHLLGSGAVSSGLLTRVASGLGAPRMLDLLWELSNTTSDDGIGP